MKFSSKDELLDIIDDFYLLFGNKYSSLIPLLLKTVILTQELPLDLEKAIKMQNSTFDYSSGLFSQLLSFLSTVLGKDIKMHWKDGILAEYRKISIFDNSPDSRPSPRQSHRLSNKTDTGLSAISRNSVSSRISVQEAETLDTKQKFNVKGYRALELQILNDMICARYSQSYFEFYALED
jgi:hypothetical protein